MRTVRVSATIISTSLIVVLIAAIALGVRLRGSDEAPGVGDRGATEETMTSEAQKNDASTPTVVRLSPEKLSKAAIRVAEVTRGTLTHTHTVPGRVAYNDNRHIEVTTPSSGILTQLLVQPASDVQSGQILAWLNSPEIGSARADALQLQAASELASDLADRAVTLERNVTAVTSELKKQPDYVALRKQFAGRLLGDYRNRLFGAYSRAQLAESLVKNAVALSPSGTISGKVTQERQAEARAARAALEAECEQAMLDARKERRAAEATAGDATRRLAIARQHLASLLLSETAIRPDTDMPELSTLGASDDDLDRLSRVAVRAAFAGTIESRHFSAGERVQPTDSLFVLADTSSLWITANIRENDWPAITITPGQPLMVTVPALGDAALKATVVYIGREVSPETNAIPIVAQIDNSKGNLRPGLFVRVSIPIGTKDDVLTAPEIAVMQHDGRSFVFTPESGDRFRRVDVMTGEDGDGRVEIVQGLNAGDRTVTHGAFALKSELLLESEGE